MSGARGRWRRAARALARENTYVPRAPAPAAAPARRRSSELYAITDADLLTPLFDEEPDYATSTASEYYSCTPEPIPGPVKESSLHLNGAGPARPARPARPAVFALLEEQLTLETEISSTLGALELDPEVEAALAEKLFRLEAAARAAERQVHPNRTRSQTVGAAVPRRSSSDDTLDGLYDDKAHDSTDFRLRSQTAPAAGLLNRHGGERKKRPVGNEPGLGSLSMATAA